MILLKISWGSIPRPRQQEHVIHAECASYATYRLSWMAHPTQFGQSQAYIISILAWVNSVKCHQPPLPPIVDSSGEVISDDLSYVFNP